jgi:hypothetical protein
MAGVIDARRRYRAPGLRTSSSRRRASRGRPVKACASRRIRGEIRDLHGQRATADISSSPDRINRRRANWTFVGSTAKWTNISRLTAPGESHCARAILCLRLPIKLRPRMDFGKTSCLRGRRYRQPPTSISAALGNTAGRSSRSCIVIGLLTIENERQRHAKPRY